MADNETITVELPLDTDGFFSCLSHPGFIGDPLA